MEMYDLTYKVRTGSVILDSMMQQHLKVHGEDTPYRYSILVNRSNVLRMLGKYEEAITASEEVRQVSAAQLMNS